MVLPKHLLPDRENNTVYFEEMSTTHGVEGSLPEYNDCSNKELGACLAWLSKSVQIPIYMFRIYWICSPLAPVKPNLSIKKERKAEINEKREARSLRHLPKPVVLICRRLAQLAGGRRARGPWVELERETANRLLHQVIIKAASDRQCMKSHSPIYESEDAEQERKVKKRQGLLQSQVSCDTGILQLLLTSDTSVDTVNNGLCELDLVKMSGSETSKLNVPGMIPHISNYTLENNGAKVHGCNGTENEETVRDSVAEPCHPITPHHILCIAEAMAELEVPELTIKQRVDYLQNIVNEEGAWAEVSTESDPKILSTLLWDWLQQLSEPVLSRNDVNVFCDGDWRQNLKKLSRCQGETLCCLLQCVSKLSSLPVVLEDLVLLRLLKALTQQPPVTPNLSATVLCQLHSIVSEIRAHGVTSRLQRRVAEPTQWRQLSAEIQEEKIS
ncbi:uncharacterized protein LOC143774977 [Ranitomeya variabilis]|uniref:uncharacterized protein LOC143774977 n=1 Tax=Ranitomeya variabilis TaxID=490064 RepID=UPI0040577477